MEELGGVQARLLTVGAGTILRKMQNAQRRRLLSIKQASAALRKGTEVASVGLAGQGWPTG